MILSVDPGETTGIAMWTEEGELLARDMWGFDRLLTRLSTEHWVGELSTIVMEDFHLYERTAPRMVGNKFVVCQVIGAFRLLAKMHDIELIMQSPGILNITAMHAGIKRVTDHRKSHDEDAYLHGFRYFLDKEILKPLAQRP